MCLAEHDILDETYDVDKNYNFFTDVCITIYTGRTYFFENLVYEKLRNVYSGRTHRGDELEIKPTWIISIEH